MKKIFFPVILMGLMLSGCGGGASEDKPVTEVKSEAQTLSIEQLKSIIAKYEAAIESKKTLIAQLTAQLKDIPMAQMMGEEAGKIKADIASATASIKALSERLNVYLQALKSKS